MKISVEFEGQTFQAEAQNIRGTLWVHFNGRTFVYETEQQKKRGRGKSEAIKSGTIAAPMPGKIIKILKSKGDSVQVGDVVIVMEAMKMEYTLKSQAEGVIKTLDCKLGEQVSLGRALVHIDPKAGEST